MLGGERLAVAAVTAGGAFICAWLVKRRCRSQLSQDQLRVRVVVITGCDSGVGFSAALHCHKQGLTVVALVLSAGSTGARTLIDLGKVIVNLLLFFYIFKLFVGYINTVQVILNITLQYRPIFLRL